jgi:hypothetical protein
MVLGGSWKSKREGNIMGGGWKKIGVSFGGTRGEAKKGN